MVGPPIQGELILNQSGRVPVEAMATGVVVEGPMQPGMMPPGMMQPGPMQLGPMQPTQRVMVVQ